MAEIGEPIDVYRHEALYRLNYGDKAVRFWPDIDRFVAELVALFPGSGSEVRAFYAHIMDLYDHVIGGVSVFEAPTEARREELMRRFRADPLRQLRMISLIFRNAESLMKRYVRSKELRRFFDKLTSTYCYTTLEETPAILAATMFSDNHVGGSYYPAASPMALSARLEKALEKFGGRIRFRADVSRIAPKEGGGFLIEMLTSAGTRSIDADLVLFAGAARNLATRLAAPGLLPERWIRKVASMEMSWPSFVVYGSLDAARLPEDLMPVEMFIDNKESLDEGDVTLYVSGLEDPSLAPEGILPFTLIGPSFRSWPSPHDEGYRSEAYEAAKETEIARMIDAVDRRRRGFAAAVISRFGGSPSTIERYLAKPGGSVAGPKQRMGQHLMLRPGSRTPATGLYLCGESTVMGTGTPAVTVSGISAANAILRDLGLPDYSERGELAEAVRIIPRGTRGNPPVGEEAASARLCQWCEEAPCRAACPVSLDLPGLMRALEFGNVQGARRLVREADPPCDSCGARPPCEESCLRPGFGGGRVPIARLVASCGPHES
jgi:prolycopene isomerase